MAQQTINVGTAPNDGTGTPLRTAFQYTNSNFSELYTAVGPSGNNIVVPGNATITGDLTVDTSTLKVDSANNRVGVNNATPGVAFHIGTTGGTNRFAINTAFTSGGDIQLRRGAFIGFSNAADSGNSEYLFANAGALDFGINGSTAMTLNSTGLGVGVVPQNNLHIKGASGTTSIRIEAITDGTLGFIAAASGVISGAPANNLAIRAENGLYLSGGGNATQFILNSSGNVGIGVTPSAWTTYYALQVRNGSIANYSPTQDLRISSNAYYASGVWKRIAAAYATQYLQDGSSGQHQWYTAATGAADSTITTFTTAAMTLDASGNLLVGTASVGGIFDTKFFLSSNSGTNKWAVGPYAATPTNFAIIPTPGTGGVYLSGTSATSWTAYSDERLKDIIEPITNALTKVGSLRAIIGKFKGDEANTRRPFLIAQDLQSALPEAVDASNPDRLGVSYTDVIPLLVAAIKELAARVQTLETR